MDQSNLLADDKTEALRTAGATQSDPYAPIPAGRFVLRPLRASDAGLIRHYTADRRVAEGTRAIPHPLPP
ncbi:hypothetical protein ABFV79_16225, partial [Brucella melitensis]